MPGEVFAEFMRRRGRRIAEGAGGLWYSTSMGIYMSIPLHEPCTATDAEIERLMRRTPMLGVRFPSPHRAGLTSGVYIRRRPYDFSAVQPRLRSQVRKGLNHCEIRRVEAGELLRDGLVCNRDTMERQHRADAEFTDPKQWRRLVTAVEKSPNIEPIGAFVDGKLAAYIIGCREDGWFHILHQMSRLNSLDFAPNHALDFHVTKEAFSDPGIEGVCFGLVGLTSTSGLNDYKHRLGYEVRPMNSIFVLHPWAAKLLDNSTALGSIAWLRRVRPNYNRLGQVESILTGARMTRIGLEGAKA